MNVFFFARAKRKQNPNHLLFSGGPVLAPNRAKKTLEFPPPGAGPGPAGNFFFMFTTGTR